MALTLLESRKLGSGEVMRDAVIEEYAANSDILRVLPFENIEGGAYAYNREDTLPAVGFRGINESYPEGTGVINPQVETLSIAGGDLDVDQYLIDTHGPQSRSTHEMMKVKALSLRWTREFIKGDSTTNPRVFDGLQARVTGTQLMNAGSTSGGDALSLAMLDDVIDLVDMPTHIIMNKKMRNLLTAASRTTSITGFINYEQSQLGQRVTTYNGLPILIADYDNEGAQILGFTEANPGGGSPASTSIYVVSLGSSMLTGIQGRSRGQFGVSVRDLGEQDAKPVLRTRIEWNSGFAVLHGRAIARLQGLRSAAVVA
jgi:hypothetical protein